MRKNANQDGDELLKKCETPPPTPNSSLDGGINQAPFSAEHIRRLLADDQEPTTCSILEDAKAATKKTSKVSNFVDTLIWILLSVAVVHYSQLIEVVQRNQIIHRQLLNTGAALTLLNLVIGLYMWIYYRCVKRIENWVDANDTLAYFAAIVAVIAALWYVLK